MRRPGGGPARDINPRMPTAPRPLRDGSLAEQLGVTRVARLTGLDRTGVEVASAVRPGAHVLQVTNGKGASFADATAGALLEAAELWAAERAVVDVWDSAAGLVTRHGAGAVVPPDALAPGLAEPGWASLRLAWRAGQELFDGDLAFVPACAVHCPPAGGPLLGPAVVPWTSNGMGAHEDRAAALLHALLEVVERDLVARALPEGFTEETLAARALDRRSLARAAPRTGALAARLEERGFEVHLLDASGDESEGAALPCAAAVLVDHALGPVPLSAGYACRLGRDDALLAALLEAAQSRATEIHGAREDVALGDRHAATGLAALLAATRPRRDAGQMPEVRTSREGGAAAGVRAVLLRLRRAGVARAAAVALDAPAGVHVVKVLVPGFACSELL
jgi:ribosomal protein S12 methylthiotransferase accessory factor